MDKDHRSLLLVTEPSPQSQLFVDYLRQQLDCPVALVLPRSRPVTPAPSSSLILLDVDHMDDASLQAWYTDHAGQPGVSQAVFNLRDEDRAAELLTTMHLQGVFYRQDDLSLICKGVKTLMEGHPWMSRSLMARLLEFLRQQQRNVYRPTYGLTQREREIIGLLGSGASNHEIAERLAISEHTVKSHLYNTFKKIGVNTRGQAVRWACQHLGTPPLYLERQAETGPPQRTCS
ncbi:LuxR C-terminal-related transcriptional regulator [Halomonas caseinilytica]|uniref:LuxR family transcriptional regulator, csgAB operon transcriptional regulatory protein n=1 Tax=Halomonas caseinilytica TaxID=438744 RepID=A0A1M6WFD2_9GAMM|nr:LuxR C-terminal-related transcriptional regulator [Halomonas caseinilytica]SHK92225.1 LuxR family transcriptional regulator, csgAB operon transcriptional regulatory protein [Halomonas caseinilytica]